MKIRFQADADLNQRIIHAVRRRHPAVDFQTADESGIRGLLDPDVLAFAASEGRSLVSHDCNTMPVHFAQFIATHRSPGVFMITQDLPIGLAANGLILICEASDAKEWVDVLEWLPL